MTLAEALLEVAHGDERAVLFTVLDGPEQARKLLVRLDRGETIGDGPPALAALADELRRSCIIEHEGARSFVSRGSQQLGLQVKQGELATMVEDGWSVRSLPACAAS